MNQIERERHESQRVALGASIDRTQHEQLFELARREDRSVSAIVRRVVANELEAQRERRAS
jgi:post-segregation antitoxin (ccd killing protein)